MSARSRWPPLLLAALLGFAAVHGAVARAPVASEAAQSTGPDEGAELGAAIEAQRASLEDAGAVAALETRLSGAATADERARLVASELERTERRYDDLDRRLSALRAARENGSIPAAEYPARARPLVRRAQSLGARIERVRALSERVDGTALGAVNVTPERFDRLATAVDRLVDEAGVAPPRGLDPAFYRQLATAVHTYNSEVGSYDLGVLGAHLGGERVEVVIRSEDGRRAVVSFRTTVGHRVRDLRAGPHPGATTRVRVSERRLRDIAEADSPGVAASRAYVAGHVRVEGVGTLDAVKWAVVDGVLATARALRSAVDWVGGLVP